MNADLKNLLIEMPKPLVLIDEATKEVVLVNKEFSQLISMPDHNNTKSIALKLTQKIFEPFNYIEGLGDHYISE